MSAPVAEGAERRMRRPTVAAMVAAALCALAIALFLWRYPLPIGFLVGGLALYAAALWRWPWAWLVVIPAVIPSLGLTPWTGWTLFGEADLFVLATIAIVTLRDPPRVMDLLPKGPARAVILLAGLSLCAACCIGLESPYGAHGSSLALMRPDNAFRAVKGFAVAVALMPFLRHRDQVHGDALRLLAFGILVGLSLVAAETFVERAVFPGAFDVFQLYPAAGPFASMNVGGGHLGVYVATALPFALLRRSRTRRLERFAMRFLDLAATYVVFVTFSVIIYTAAALATGLTFLGRTGPSGEAAGSRRKGEKGRGIGRLLLRAGYALLMIVAAAGVLLGYDAIAAGVTKVAVNIVHREESLGRRLNLRDGGWGRGLFGMGLGAFPRVSARSADGRSDFAVLTEDGHAFLRLTTGDAFFFGQKTPVAPGSDYVLTASVRSPDGKSYATALLCEKHLLYSRDCVAHDLRPMTAGKWETITLPFSTASMDATGRFGPFRRPIDLAFHTAPSNMTIDIRDVRFTGPDGAQLIANGNFARGTDRWYFTDEDHDRWQIMNQYLMILFESGVFGLAAFLILVGAAIIGARRAMKRGDKVGTAIVASLGAFLFLCLFEPPLQSPPISATFHLICFSGLLMLERGTYRAYLAKPRFVRPTSAANLGPAQPLPSQMRDAAAVSTASTARTPSASRAASGVRSNTSS